jgi:hypothetical protein
VSTLGTVTTEIERLHTCFERWYHGDEFDFAEFEDAMADDFTFFAPNGSSVPRSDVVDGVRNAFGSRHIRIRIEQTAVLWERGDDVLVAYEEWHDHDDYSTARRSTVLLTRNEATPGGFLWRHVHETWIQPPPG